MYNVRLRQIIKNFAAFADLGIDPLTICKRDFLFLTNTSIRFFCGSRGEVCTLEALHLTKNVADHPLRDRHILAMGTLTKVLWFDQQA